MGYLSGRMKLRFLFFFCAVRSCVAVRLSPLENNDKLQDISNQYVAEWQWESWPIKQGPSEQDSRSPGRRVNTALWKDSSNTAWYLFGGQPADSNSKKVYSDVWKYTIKTRVWERFFPSQSDAKANSGKIGGMMTLRASLFDEGNPSNVQRRNYTMVLCGGVSKTNSTRSKKLNIWSNFTRRKKQEEEPKEYELKSLAVYAPRTSKSNTVWQIDLKDKLWTAYVCCCDTANSEKGNFTSKPAKTEVDKNKTHNATQNSDKIERYANAEKNESSALDSKIDRAEDEVENEQEHSGMANSKNKKKKINQTKKTSENQQKKVKVEKRKSEENATKAVAQGEDYQAAGNKSVEMKNAGDSLKTKKEKYNLKLKEGAEQPTVKNKTEHPERVTKAKVASKYCPEFSEDGRPVTWCDGNNELLITADVSSPLITLWVFNLRTSHWSQLEVRLRKGVKWPGCSDMNSVRYAGNEEDVFMVCSPRKKKSPGNSTNPSRDDYPTKAVYRINYRNRFLDGLSEIRLNPYFGTSEGRAVWQNDTQSTLQVIRTPENETLLLLAYQDKVDLWILNGDDQGRESFDVVEKIWRGSASKWFDKYNAVLYNLQFVADSGKSETMLIPNPRNISVSDYWPRERGRFIIRIFKNENLKNQTFENRTREQNLTYELLQSDYKPSEGKSQYSHTYSLKVLVFFGISLAIFTVFGLVVFLKRCVNCPPRIRIRNECHKSPLVIRYSVIPDDLLYPVA